jgi:hypothetical protein
METVQNLGNLDEVFFTNELLLLLLFYYYYLSPLCRVFTVLFLKQTTFVGYRVIWLLCSYNLWCT